MPVSLLFVASSLFTGVAQAASQPPPPRLVAVQKVPMSSVNITSVTRTPDGGATLQLSNGKSIQLSKTDYEQNAQHINSQVAPAQGVQTNGVVYGDCGDSWIYLWDLGGTRYQFTTGFDVNSPAYYYAWHAFMAGAGGTTYNYDYHSSGGLANRSSWTGQHTANVPRRDWYFVEVIGSDSYAFTSLNGICFSEYPNDEWFV